MENLAVKLGYLSKVNNSIPNIFIKNNYIHLETVIN